MLTDTVLPGWLAEFRRTHPGVHIEAVAGHQNLSLRRRQADIAIRATAQPPEDAIGRRICSFRFGFFATEECLARQGERHLRDMEFVGISGIQSWFVPTLWKSAKASERRLVYHSSSVGSAVQAARAGMGVLPMAYYGVAPFDDLLHLSPYPPKDMALWLLVHPDLRRTTRVKVLKDFLADKLAGHASVFDGTSAGPPRLDVDWAAM